MASILDGNFAFLVCAGSEDGAPIASNNGVERDGETQRLTVHCSEKNCKKRQCRAIKMSFRDSASMGDMLLNRIMTLMRVKCMQKSIILLKCCDL